MKKSCCDRCGREVNIRQVLASKSPIFEIKQIITQGSMPVELCEYCSKDFAGWLKGGSGNGSMYQ